MYREEEYRNEKGSAKIIAYVVIATLAIIVISLFIMVSSCLKSYNNLVKLDEAVEASISEIETQLQGRVELVPDLLAVVEIKAAHQEKMIEAIADARKSLALATDNMNSALKDGDLATTLAADDALTTAVSDFKVVVERYPDFSSDTEYSNLMYQIEGAVNRIRVARESYTKAVHEYNTHVKSLPTRLFASALGFEEREYIKASDAAHQDSVINYNK